MPDETMVEAVVEARHYPMRPDHFGCKNLA